MRIVVTLATLLALHSGVLAGGLYAGDEAPRAAADAIVPAGTAPGDCDTSVYHLEHARAGQLIGRVKSLIAQISAYAAEEDVAALPKSVVLLPTSSDDTIIAICPRAHAGLVKHAIKSCDSLKQYAVKVQLFEVGDNGKTIPVGGPHLLIGREGSVQCTTPGESVSLNFKVDTPIADGNTEEPNPTDSETAEVASEHAGVTCAGAGRCRPGLSAADRRNVGGISVRPQRNRPLRRELHERFRILLRKRQVSGLQNEFVHGLQNGHQRLLLVPVEQWYVLVVQGK